MVISVTSVTSIAAQINSLPSDLLPLEQIVKAVSRHRGVHLMVGSGSSSGKISWKKKQTLGFSNKVMGWGFDGIYLHIYIYVICLHVYDIVYIYSQYMPILCDYEIEMGLSGKWGRGICPNFCLFKWGKWGFRPIWWSFMEFHPWVTGWHLPNNWIMSNFGMSKSTWFSARPGGS